MRRDECVRPPKDRAPMCILIGRARVSCGGGLGGLQMVNKCNTGQLQASTLASIEDA